MDRRGARETPRERHPPLPARRHRHRARAVASRSRTPLASGITYRAADPFHLPSNDPARIAQLRAQDGRRRELSALLQTVLRGASILPGREQEARVVWENLAARARTGDVAASEDLTTLTLFLANELAAPEQGDELRELTERTLEAVVLPRHKQAQLGRLCRIAVTDGDRAAALAALTQMTVDAPDIDSDSEYRVSAAAVAALDRDAARVIALLGERKDAVPIEHTLDALATVLRANALELAGDVARAVEELRELPHPVALDEFRAAFAPLDLCPRSAVAFVAGRRRAGGQGRSGDRGTGFVVGFAFLLIGLVLFAVVPTATSAPHAPGDLVPLWIAAVSMTLSGSALVWRGVRKGRRMRHLRQNGIARTGRVLAATPSGASEGEINIYTLTVELTDETGRYAATVPRKMPDDEVPELVGQPLRVLVNPADRTDIILDE